VNSVVKFRFSSVKMSQKRNENWCPICYAFCGYRIHRHSCYVKADQAGKKKIYELNFQMRSDFYRHIFIDPASDSFPQLDGFSREQVLNLLTELGHRVVPYSCYLDAPYRLSTALVAPILASSLLYRMLTLPLLL
jgi:hypothetical protein